nr:hypothetical protein [uncultured Niameybacter sp.]
MEQLFESLNRIVEYLNQIYTITQNQTTILLDSKQAGDSLNLIEEMATYKNEITTELEKEEEIFQTQYSLHKASINEVEVQRLLKQTVGHVLALKDKVIQLEQKNVLIMQDLLKRLTEKVEIPKNPEFVTMAYKKHGKE